MINVIVELSKYIILTLMIIYTFHCFYTVRQPDEEERNELLRQQLLLIFFIDFTAFLIIYLKTFNFQVVEFYAEMLLFFAAIQILYRLFYKKASILLLNNMCMLLSVGFIMLCRLDISAAQKQLLIAAGASGIALIIPVMIRKMRFLRKLTWVYAGIGIVLLGAVFALARTSYGAKLSLMGVQPSEAIKITFVFFHGILFIKRHQFPCHCAGISRCRTSRRNSGTFQRPWKCRNLFCRIPYYGLCCHKKCRISRTWYCRRFRCSSCGLPSFRACPSASKRLERPDGCLSE